MRGLCKDEGVICKPRLTALGKRSMSDVRLLIEGYDPKQIAEMTNRQQESVHHSLAKAREKLGVDNNTKMIRMLRGIHQERRDCNV